MFFNVLNVSYGFNEFLLCLYRENHGEDKTPMVFNVVRIIVGILIQIGLEKYEPIEIKNIIEGNYKNNYKKIAPPQGLYLLDVEY